ncbi:MAG: hypothetical protein QXR06_04620 [Candidatus Bathyarchaeia archaeon]|nr:hypothetical protein [Candidatus Bathyarchaeota archaeon]
MLKNADYGFLIASALGISFIGIALVLPLAAYPPALRVDVPFRKPLMGSLLAIICLIGISAVFFPKKCSKTIRKSERMKAPQGEDEGLSPQGEPVNFRGHHPDCRSFADHIIHMKGRIFCAACTGLLIGALLVLAETFFYFFMEWCFLGQLGLWAVFAGQVGVALGLFQFRFRGFTRSALNAFFVLACFLILAGVDSLAENVLFDLYVVGLIVFWLFTRILTSQWDHLRICKACVLQCGLKR